MMRCGHALVAERTSVAYPLGSLVTCLHCSRSFPSLGAAILDGNGGMPSPLEFKLRAGMHDLTGCHFYNRSDALRPRRRFAA